ncbi:MAG TPA: YsnF/AvaK domain-containing protein [Acidimicrobiia bacterium]|jgi:uncharacterized protein (TIGR02271 family)
MSNDDYAGWIGRTARDSIGEKIGKIDNIYSEGGAPTWVTIHTGLFGHHVTFAPLAGSQRDGHDLRLAFGKAKIKDAPRIDPESDLTPDEETRLREHYRTGTAEAGADATGGEGASMTRSEEEVRVDTERVESGRARLTKHVVTEEQQVTVPVRREEVRVEREPIDADHQPDGAPEIGEDEQELVLHEERPVVRTEVVPKETVRLSKVENTDEREVDAEVRKEQVDVDDGS